MQTEQVIVYFQNYNIGTKQDQFSLALVVDDNQTQP